MSGEEQGDPRPTGRRPSWKRTLARAAVAALAGCALGLAAIPAASAKRDHESGSSGTSTATSTQTAGQSTTSASTRAPSGASPPASSGASTPASSDASKPARSGASLPAPPRAPDGVSAPSASPTRRHGAAKHRGQASGGGSAATSAPGGEAARGQSTSEPGEPGEASAADEAGAADEAQAEPLTAGGSGHKAKAGKGHHKEGAGGGTRPKETGKQSKGKSKETTEPKGEAPPGEAPSTTPKPVLAAAPPVETLAAPAAATAPAATAPATPTLSTRAPASGLSSPVRISHRPRAVRHRARARAGAPFRGPAPLGSVAAAPTARPRSGAVSRGAGHVRARPAHGGGGGRVSRLVRTITRIVDVVPMGVRALIVGLLALAVALAVRSGASGLRAGRLARQRRELLDDVGLLQAALLPESPERLGPVGTSVAYRPAEGPAAGGDFYDVFELEDGRLAVILGDVSGHGRQALPHTALVRFTLRAYLEAGLSPRDALQTAGAVLERQLGEVFATVVVAVYEPGERVLTYACAGHPPPVVLGAQPGARSLSPVTVCSAPPIGMGMRTGTRQTTVSLPGRARVCFYTDGVTEARVGAELFGTGRLVDELERLGPEASASELLERVAARADARPDDMAACMLSVPGEDDSPLVLVEELEIDRAQAGDARTEGFLRACGIPREDVAEVIGAVCETAGRAGTVVLEVSAGGSAPRVAMHRDHVAQLHARRARTEVPL